MDMMSSFAGLRADAPGGENGAYGMRLLKKTMKADESAANRMLEMLPEKQSAAATVIPKGKNLDVFA